MTSLSLTLLGSFGATLAERPLDQFRTNKVQALLIYLVAETSAGVPGVHRREAIMELLWPGLPQPSAQVNLRQIIYQLHKLVPDTAVAGNGDAAAEAIASAVPLLLAERQTVQLNPANPVSSDVAAFTTLLRRSRVHNHTDLLTCADCQAWLEEAAALYRGDFLADFILYDSNTYEAWSQVKRESLHRQMLDALDTLTQIYTEQANYRQAEANARRQLEMDSYRESAYRQLMRVLALSGRRSEALAVYENGRRLLSEELGMAPAVKTTALYEQIRAGDLSLVIPAPKGIRGYDVQEKIGEGAFGAVHRAYQKGVGREVAVKIIHPQYANQPNFIRRFEAEAQMVARLEHPYIVPLYDYWREPDSAYLVMRWLRGGSLQDALAKRPYPAPAALTLIEQIAAALHVAHRQGIIHRDVKPSNILLDEEGNAYLSDFGIAKDTGSAVALTLPHEMVGSPAYISPEQLLGELVTPATDVYSLGLVLFEALTGARPFSTTSMAELIRQQVNEPLPLVCAQRPDLPTAVDGVIQRATAKKASERFPDAPALAAAFREAIHKNGDGRPISPPTIAAIAAMDIVPESEIVNPYKGLRPFLETDAARFYGRNALVQQLLSRFDSSSNLPPFSARERPFSSAEEGEGRGGGRFLAVVGPSGSGKSSVVKAGLIPALRNGALPGSENWFVAEMMPGSHPLEELEATLLRVAVNPPPSLLEPLQKDERGLARVLKRILPLEAVNGNRLSVIGKENRSPITDYGLPITGPSQLLLVIDQFEELFTLVTAEADRVHFINSLLAALAEPYSRLWLVLTLRADFYDRPLRYTELGELLRQRTELVLPLTPAELEQAITRPAASVGVACEPALVTAVTADVKEQPGALPLVQYALTELFERRNGRTLTLVAYETIGGVTGALARRADEIYDSLDITGQATARQLFLRLITLGEGAEDTRRRVRLSEVEAIQASDVFETSDVLASYGRYRLLTFDRDPISREPTVEVAHEALLREWGRLREWLDESRADVRLQRLLAGAAAEWRTAAEDTGFLLRGSRLDQFEGWAEQTDVALTSDERAFLEVSLAARRQRRAEEEARRQRELETARQLAETERQRAEEQTQAAHRLHRRAAYLMGALLVAAVLAGAAVLFQQRAVRNEATAVANASLAATREAEARTSEAEALSNAQLAATREAEALLNANLAATRQSEAETEAIARATAEAIAIAERETAETQTRLSTSRELSLSAVNTLESDPELSILLSLQALRTAYTKEAESALHQALQLSRLRHTLTGHTDWAWSAQYTPDGKHLATLGFDNTIKVWDTATWQVERTIPVTGAYWGSVRLYINPAGTTLATVLADGYDENFQNVIFQSWELASGQALLTYTLPVPPQSYPDVSLSPDWTKLAMGHRNGTAELWEIASAQKLLTFPGHVDVIWDAPFSPDGSRLATISEDGMVKVWDVAESLVAGSAQEIVSFQTTSGGSLTGGAFNADGSRLALSFGNGLVELWDLADTGQPLFSLSGHTNQVRTLTFNADETRLASASQDGTAKVWDLTSGELLYTLSGASREPTSAVFSPDGRTIATTHLDQSVRIWDATVGIKGELATLETGPLNIDIDLSPDEKLLALGSFNSSAKVVDAATGELIWTLPGVSGGVYRVDFSPDGTKVVTAGGDNMVRIWDMATGEPILVLNGHTYGVLVGGYYTGTLDAAFSPDGTRLATVGADGIAKVWDALTGTAVLTFTGHVAALRSVTFSPDGKWIATSGDEGDATVKIWDATTGEEIYTLTGHETRVWGLAFSPDGSFLATAGYAGIVKVWDMVLGTELYNLPGQLATVGSVVFSPDGRRLYTGGIDGIRVWDMATGEELLTLSVNPNFAIALNQDGTQLFSATYQVGGVGIYALNYEELLEIAETRVTRWFTAEECSRYLHTAVCPTLP